MNTDRQFTKTQRRKLRELGGIAYERELSAELGKLDVEFGRWRAGEIDAHELSECIHRFHQGPARQLFSKYEHSNLDFAVAEAIHRGIVTGEEADADIIGILGIHLRFLRDRDRDDLK